MTYQETLDYLYSQLPMFTRIGAAAYKEGLDNTMAICKLLGNPETKFKSVHIAGTNGKGSSSHSLAAIFQAAGYKTGLYTSPHLKRFTERIKINGEEIPEARIVEFVQRYYSDIERIKPSFFELTVGIAFDYFAQEAVDIAIIEVGMGGRLDSTNVINPELCLITNIGYDHTEFLGDTLPKIASEKAGIIKPGIPVVVSESHPETKAVFIAKAAECNSSITFADEVFNVELIDTKPLNYNSFEIKDLSNSGKEYPLDFGLKGYYQQANLKGILAAVVGLSQLGYHFSDEAVKKGLKDVATITGLKGRWQILKENPLTVCDTGHNVHGLTEVFRQIADCRNPKGVLRIVFGVMRDKDLSKLWHLLPKDAVFYFCSPDMPRALEAETLQQKAFEQELAGMAYSSVASAIEAAKRDAKHEDFIFIGGSTFVVAEVPDL